MSVVPCPACGTGTPVEPGRSAPCPGCGLVVSATTRPRVRAEVAADPPARRGLGPAVVVGGVIVAGAVAAGWFAYRARVQADRMAMMEAVRARHEAEMVHMVRAAEHDRAARDVLAAEVVAFPALLVGEPLPPAEAERRAADLGMRVVGVWWGPGPDGGTREVEYRADGTFRDAVTGSPADRAWAGGWSVGGLTGTRVLRLARTGTGPVSVRLTFEGDELVHDDMPGLATVLRRQPPPP